MTDFDKMSDLEAISTMDKMSDLEDTKTESTPEKMSDVTEISESIGSFLDEQKERPSELNMIDNDILAFANQVGDDMEEGAVEGGNFGAIEDTSFTSGLAFLEGGEATKMEVGGEDLSFLQELEEDDDLSEDSDEEESGDEGSDKDEDGVFGQVSFYDDEPGSNASVDGKKGKKRKKRLKNKDGDKSGKRKRKARKEKSSDDEDKNEDEDADDDEIAAGMGKRRNIR